MNVNALIKLVRETTGCAAIPITTPLVPITTGKKPMGRWRKKRLNKKVKRSIWEDKTPGEPELEPYPDDYIDGNGEPLIHHFKSFPQEMWFEYHCFESHSSSDADLWYHSHQRCTVLGTIRSRSDFEMYAVRFKDGFMHEAGGDELFHSRSEFFRPNPPKPPKTESLADDLLSLRDISMTQGTADQGEYFRGMANAMEVAACCVTKEEPQFVTEIDMELVEPCDLKPGMYTGYRYGYCVEIDGKIYKTKNGIRCGRDHCGGPSRFRMSDTGKLFQIHIPNKYRESISKDFEQYGKPFKKVKTPEEIAKSHGSTVERVLDAIETGIAVEKEHTDDPIAARTIATAHVAEALDYYDKLDKMEHESLVINLLDPL